MAKAERVAFTVKGADTAITTKVNRVIATA
jgi:hypothetical protein